MKITKTRDIFFFDVMLVPKVITFVYWLMLFGIVGGGLVMMFKSGNPVQGLMMVVGGAVLVRVICEMMIVMFKINENLQKIVDSK